MLWCIIPINQTDDVIITATIILRESIIKKHTIHRIPTGYILLINKLSSSPELDSDGMLFTDDTQLCM